MNYKFKLEKEASVEGIGDIFYGEARFNAARNLFKKNNLQWIAARDLAGARILTGANSSLCRRGSLVREGNLSIPKRHSSTDKVKRLLLRTPIIVLDLDGIVSASPIYGGEINIDKKYAELQEQAGEDYDNPVFELKSTQPIPTNRLSEEALPIWLFGDKAQEYGALLEEEGVNEIFLGFDTADYINKYNHVYVCQLYMNDFRKVHCSEILGISTRCESTCPVRGIHYYGKK